MCSHRAEHFGDLITADRDLDVGVVVDFGAGKKGEIPGCSSKASIGSVFYDLVRWRLGGSNDEKQVKRSTVHRDECTFRNARNAQASVCPVLMCAEVGKDATLTRCCTSVWGIWSPTRL